jgi:hypothetical protein
MLSGVRSKGLLATCCLPFDLGATAGLAAARDARDRLTTCRAFPWSLFASWPDVHSGVTHYEYLSACRASKRSIIPFPILVVSQFIWTRRRIGIVPPQEPDGDSWGWLRIFTFASRTWSYNCAAIFSTA